MADASVRAGAIPCKGCGVALPPVYELSPWCAWCIKEKRDQPKIKTIKQISYGRRRNV